MQWFLHSSSGPRPWLCSGSPRQQRGAVVSVGACIGLVVFFCAFLVFSLVSVHESGNVVRQFAASRPCTSANAPPGCYQNALMLVADKSIKHGSPRMGGDTYLLGLQAASKHTYTVVLDSSSSRPRVWGALSVGQSVLTQRWHGQVVAVAADGMTDTTSENPASQSSSCQLLLWVSIVLLVLSVLVLLQAFFRQKTLRPLQD